ncbi:MAG: type IV pilus biogenesis/stability protein PilW [Colwellia sp.]
MDKTLSKIIIIALALLLPACVTQEFESDDTPVVKNQSNRDEMAITRISLGLGYLKMGNMSQAKFNLDKAKKFSPKMVQVYTAFAHYYATVGEHELTITAYEKALSIQSDNADTLNNYGVYLCRQNQVPAAEKQFLKAIAVPSYTLVAQSYDNLASCYLQIDDFEKSELYLNKAILHSPSAASILFKMVRLQYAKSDYKEARIFLQRFEKSTRRFTPQSLALAYKVYFKLGQRRTARNYGAMLVKMYPQSWEANQYLLNKLELIDADNLAKKFKLAQTKLSQSGNSNIIKTKKRVVKLSPKKPTKDKVLSTKSINAKVVSANTTVLNSIAPTNQASIASISQALTKNEKEAVVIVSEVLTVKNTPVVESEHKITAETAHAADVAKSLTASDEATAIAIKEAKVAAILAKAEPNDASIKDVSKKVASNTDEKVLQSQPKPNQENGNVEKPSEPVKALATHSIVKGDTLYSVSVKYNIKIKALRKWNQMSTRKRLYVGKTLFLENPNK